VFILTCYDFWIRCLGGRILCSRCSLPHFVDLLESLICRETCSKVECWFKPSRLPASVEIKR